MEESISAWRTTLTHRLNNSYSFLKGECNIYYFLGYSAIFLPSSTGHQKLQFKVLRHITHITIRIQVIKKTMDKNFKTVYTAYKNERI